jgi:septal ring factor EnvC (AmiA/AmiB activator)
MGAVVEYRIENSDEAHVRRSLAAKDRELAALKQRIAEQDLEIKRLKEQLAAPPLATTAE